jgi:hypothetical protein
MTALRAVSKQRKKIVVPKDAEVKAHRPYEFGLKVSVATTLNRCKGGQFIAHVKALPGNPYDGHSEQRTPMRFISVATLSRLRTQPRAASGR